MTRTRILCAAAAAFLGSAAALAQDAECPAPPANDAIDFGDRVPVTVATRDGEATFATLIADTVEEQGRGMMFRPSMQPDDAMLFVFDDYRPHYFFMRNTCISLDILYLTPEGRVASIGRNAVPYSEMLVPSPGPVTGVLEIAGGRAEELGILPGDYVVHPHFQPKTANADAPEGDDAASETDGG